MNYRIWGILPLAGVVIAALSGTRPTPACCPVFRSGKPVVNADQTVILIWDADTKTQHFIRKAAFKSDADDFGFLVPTPSQPELSESGNEAFPVLQKLTEPEKKKVRAPSGTLACGCGARAPDAAKSAAPRVRVLQEKLVAGFHAVVLEADSADVLVRWLKENGYAFSPEIEAWAKPYVEAGWKITALKVAKAADAKDSQNVAASALRITFKTDRPLFPYREPNPEKTAASLGARNRLLRIYFIADEKYQGKMDGVPGWTGRIAWSGKVKAEDRAKTLALLNLPPTTGPAQWWLTEFEDDWPYRSAPADVYFSRSEDQDPVQRPPIIEYVSSPWPADGMVYALAFAVTALPLLRRLRRGEKR
ncbi:MAG TPA: DUF2330 domain-containing protein [Gemmataceae bacterium]|nr:DUF2330 domain-containing protein [Gemmataceae bacterium]